MTHSANINLLRDKPSNKKYYNTHQIFVLHSRSRITASHLLLCLLETFRLIITHLFSIYHLFFFSTTGRFFFCCSLCGCEVKLVTYYEQDMSSCYRFPVKKKKKYIKELKLLIIKGASCSFMRSFFACVV